eukprot:GHVQ01005296.1.p1 GENE.GHVQ01005296.1~~GHVQ01005296.1.p1  ORF type:complete len:206 (-),score=27.61 GHVQ01005296.1:305-922(-)
MSGLKYDQQYNIDDEEFDLYDEEVGINEEHSSVSNTDSEDEVDSEDAEDHDTAESWIFDSSDTTTLSKLLKAVHVTSWISICICTIFLVVYSAYYFFCVKLPAMETQMFEDLITGDAEKKIGKFTALKMRHFYIHPYHDPHYHHPNKTVSHLPLEFKSIADDYQGGGRHKAALVFGLAYVIVLTRLLLTCTPLALLSPYNKNKRD